MIRLSATTGSARFDLKDGTACAPVELLSATRLLPTTQGRLLRRLNLPRQPNVLSGADQHGAADQQSDPGVAHRLQHQYQCGDSAIYQYQYRGSASNTQSNTAQSNSSNVSVSASLNETQRTRVSESIARLNVAPINNVNFSLSVGTVVPRDVRFQPLPADVMEILPQYRGYNFFVVRDDIVIVDPSTYKIVDVLPRTGRSTAAGPASAPSSHR